MEREAEAVMAEALVAGPDVPSCTGDERKEAPMAVEEVERVCINLILPVEATFVPVLPVFFILSFLAGMIIDTTC